MNSKALKSSAYNKHSNNNSNINNNMDFNNNNNIKINKIPSNLQKHPINRIQTNAISNRLISDTNNSNDISNIAISNTNNSNQKITKIKNTQYDEYVINKISSDIKLPKILTCKTNTKLTEVTQTKDIIPYNTNKAFNTNNANCINNANTTKLYNHNRGNNKISNANKAVVSKYNKSSYSKNQGNSNISSNITKIIAKPYYLSIISKYVSFSCLINLILVNKNFMSVIYSNNEIWEKLLCLFYSKYILVKAFKISNKLSIIKALKNRYSEISVNYINSKEINNNKNLDDSSFIDNNEEHNKEMDQDESFDSYYEIMKNKNNPEYLKKKKLKQKNKGELESTNIINKADKEEDTIEEFKSLSIRELINLYFKTIRLISINKLINFTITEIKYSTYDSFLLFIQNFYNRLTNIKYYVVLEFKDCFIPFSFYVNKKGISIIRNFITLNLTFETNSINNSVNNSNSNKYSDYSKDQNYLNINSLARVKVYIKDNTILNESTLIYDNEFTKIYGKVKAPIKLNSLSKLHNANNKSTTYYKLIKYDNIESNLTNVYFSEEGKVGLLTYKNKYGNSNDIYSLFYTIPINSIINIIAKSIIKETSSKIKSVVTTMKEIKLYHNNIKSINMNKYTIKNQNKALSDLEKLTSPCYVKPSNTSISNSRIKTDSKYSSKYGTSINDINHTCDITATNDFINDILYDNLLNVSIRDFKNDFLHFVDRKVDFRYINTSSLSRTKGLNINNDNIEDIETLNFFTKKNLLLNLIDDDYCIYYLSSSMHLFSDYPSITLSTLFTEKLLDIGLLDITLISSNRSFIINKSLPLLINRNKTKNNKSNRNTNANTDVCDYNTEENEEIYFSLINDDDFRLLFKYKRVDNNYNIKNDDTEYDKSYNKIFRGNYGSNIDKKKPFSNGKGSNIKDTKSLLLFEMHLILNKRLFV